MLWMGVNFEMKLSSPLFLVQKHLDTMLKKTDLCTFLTVYECNFWNRSNFKKRHLNKTRLELCTKFLKVQNWFSTFEKLKHCGLSTLQCLYYTEFPYFPVIPKRLRLDYSSVRGTAGGGLIMVVLR